MEYLQLAILVALFVAVGANGKKLEELQRRIK